MMSNCDNCIFRGQLCEKENKCPLFKEDPELEEGAYCDEQGEGSCSM